MKKYLLSLLTIVVAAYANFNLVSCADNNDAEENGSIYGIVTVLGTAEPMKAVGIELYKKDSNSSNYALLLKTVTFDDGHFEFPDLIPNNYQVKVVADGYEQTEEGLVTVEAGRQARIDLQVRKIDTYITVFTSEAYDEFNAITLRGSYKFNSNYNPNNGMARPNEAGFVYGTQNNPKDRGTVIRSTDDIEHNFDFSVRIPIDNDPNYKAKIYFQAFAKNSYGTTYGEVHDITIDRTIIDGW